MAAISQTISNVLGGVSQQPDPVKLPGQVRSADNVYLDPTFGCRKRPGTQFISKLADDIPDNAIWIPIFRDERERYIACMYNGPDGTVIKAWAADSGLEFPVTLEGSAADYIAYTNRDKIKSLTINDYTLLVNGEKTTSMNSDSSIDVNQEALIVVNQVAYNTTYNIDFLKDGELEQVKVFKASKLSISPSSFEVDDEGSCDLQDVESFVVNTQSGTGLGFTITTACNPTLITGEEEGKAFPVGVEAELVNGRTQVFYEGMFGNPDNYTVGSYLYKNLTTPNSAITVRFEAQVRAKFTGSADGNRYDAVSEQIVSYDENREWERGTVGFITSGGEPAEINITNVRRTQPTPTYEYKSKYTTNVNLNNGGSDVRIGDTATVSMKGKSYTVKVEDEVFGFGFVSEAGVSYTTPADLDSGALDVGQIVANLTGQINGLAEYTAEPIGNVIYVIRDDDRSFNVQVKGGAADRALYGLKDAVNDVSLLPAQGKDGVTLKVSNSSESDADDYYVKFTTQGGIPGQGFWEETVAPGIPINLNNASMPHAMIIQDDGTFVVRPLSEEYDDENFWAARDAGDDKTNPVPTFVDKPIKDLFFFQNRLGILSDDTVILSQAGDYFNFFQGSSIAISDADPIDLAASSTKPTSLKAAIGTAAGLLLFAENSQFLLATEDVAFGPATVKMTEITNYSYDSVVKPVETGVSVLFCTSAETFTKVFELSTDSLQARALVSENTRIVPEFIPPDINILTSAPNSSMILIGSGDKNLYVFKFYNTGNERNLAGWARWVMPTDVKMISFAHDTGYIVGNNSSGQSILTKMELLDDPDTSPIQAFGVTFTPRLDHYLFEEQVEIVAGETRSEIRLPDGFFTEGKIPFLVATFNGSETFFTSGDVLTDDNGLYLEVDSAILNSNFIVGLGYTMSLTLPSFFLKSGDQNRADRRFPPMVENLYLELYYSGRYEAIVSRVGYVDRVIELDTTISDVYIANSPAIQYFDTRAVPIYSRGDLVTVTVVADDPLPAALTSYSWEGHYNTRGIASR